MIAAGPFLLANGDLSAFEELLRRADDDPTTQILILVFINFFEIIFVNEKLFQLGPFVDERSSYVQNLHDKTYDQVFNEMIEKIKR